MSIASYQDLQDEVALWVGRSDAEFVGRIPTAIELAESAARRQLREMRAEDAITIDVLSGAASLPMPADFIGLRSDPEFNDGTGRTLSQAAAPFIQNEEITRGEPDLYYISGDTLLFRPAADGDQGFTLNYYIGVPALTDESPMNWLIAFHPHAYFYGTLAEMFRFSGEVSRRKKWEARFNRAIEQIMDIDQIDRWNGTPMSMVSRIVPLDAPLLGHSVRRNVVGGVPSGPVVDLVGLESNIVFPTMGFAAASQSGVDLSAALAFPVMSVAATLDTPGALAANLSFPVMSMTAIVAGNTVLNAEDFAASIGSWTSPGVESGGSDAAWTFVAAGGTPSSGTGPSGGSNPTTQATEAAGNGYMYSESSDGAGATNPFTLESEAFDASLGLITLTFDVHAFWNSANNAEFRVEGYNGTVWSTIGATVVTRLQTSNAAAYTPSSALDVYDSTGFSNADFRFRFVVDKETVGPDRFQYDTAIDNVQIIGPIGA